MPARSIRQTKLAKLFLLPKMPTSATSPVVPITVRSPNAALAISPTQRALASEETKLASDCDDAETIATAVNRRSSRAKRKVSPGSIDQRVEVRASTGTSQGRV